MTSFIETELFTRLVKEYLSDDEYQELQMLLIRQPDAGVVVRGSGGEPRAKGNGAATA